MGNAGSLVDTAFIHCVKGPQRYSCVNLTVLDTPCE